MTCPWHQGWPRRAQCSASQPSMGHRSAGLPPVVRVISWPSMCRLAAIWRNESVAGSGWAAPMIRAPWLCRSAMPAQGLVQGG